jgi:hypothetical protein
MAVGYDGQIRSYNMIQTGNYNQFPMDNPYYFTDFNGYTHQVSMTRTIVALNANIYSNTYKPPRSFSSVFGQTNIIEKIWPYYDIYPTNYHPGQSWIFYTGLNYQMVLNLDVASQYCEVVNQLDVSSPGRYLYQGGTPYLNNVSTEQVYTTFQVVSQGPWGSWNYGSWDSGFRMLPSSNTIQALTTDTYYNSRSWTFECWVRPITNPAGTNNPAVNSQYSALVYPAPVIITPIAYSATWNGTGPRGGSAGIGLWVDQYKVCILERGSNYLTAIINYAYTFDTSKFYQIVIKYQPNCSTCSYGYIDLYINASKVATVYTTLYNPMLDLSQLLCGNSSNWGGNNPFFVGYTQTIRAWRYWMQDTYINWLYTSQAPRYNLPNISYPYNAVCAYSVTYARYTTQYIYQNGLIQDTGETCNIQYG